jgi:hypothetical protein
MNQVRCSSFLVQSPVNATANSLHRLVTEFGKIFLEYVKVVGWWSTGIASMVVFLFLFREFWRTRQLLHRLDWPRPSITTLGLFVLGTEARSLYKVARLRIESELLTPLDPRPHRICFDGETEYREAIAEWLETRREWRQARSSQLRSLVRSGESTKPIEITNCSPLIDEDAIERYFNAVATQRLLWDSIVYRARRIFARTGVFGMRSHFDPRSSDGLSGEEPKFLSKITIGSGFVAPTHLLTGLLSRYDESWEKVSVEYGKSVIDPDDAYRYSEIRRTQASILSMWLVWGPSIPICSCPAWYGDVLLQYGVVDEDNSIGLRCSSPDIIRTLHRPNSHSSGALAFPARVTGTLRWGPALRESAVCPAQHAICHDDRLVLDITEGSVERPGGSIEAVYATMYSAYLWIAFAMCKAGTDEPVHPDQQWRDLIPFFEHANIADGATYEFHASQLASAAVAGARQLLKRNGGLSLRFVCAVDESGCGDKLLYPAKTTMTIRQKMVEHAAESANTDPAMNRLILDFDPGHPWKDGDYSACALPTILKDYYEFNKSEEDEG